MSDLKNTVQSTMTAAMKEKNKEKLQAIRMIWNAIRKKEIDDRKDLNDGDIQKILQTLLKQSHESLEQAEKAAREDQVAEIKAEQKVIQSFLPEPLSEAELETIVQKSLEGLRSKGDLPQGGAAMGLLMKAVMAEVGARAGGKEVQNKVRQALGL